MYININYIHSKEFTLPEVFLLQVIKQNKQENLENEIALYVTDEILDKFTEQELITYVKKSKKDDSDFKVMRLTKKAIELLDNFETAEITDEDIELYNWLEQFYKSEDKSIGNKKRTKSGIAHFRNHTGITRNHLAFLLKCFISDDENMKYNNKLEKVFYSSNSVYSRKFNIDECRLYTYYEKRKEWFDNKFKEIKN